MRNSRTVIASAVFPILALLLLTTPLSAQQSCKELRSLRLPNTVITSATTVYAGSFTPPGFHAPLGTLPAFCRVAATTKPAIRFEVWLPLHHWNGKFQGVGNGGTAGVISYRAMAGALRRGYATASTDTGHANRPPTNGFDATWALGHPELVADFGYRGLHLTTVNAKQIAQEFYGKEPVHSYYVGCSQGGQQGLMEAQRFPEDYDGLLVGDPANNWTRHYAGAHLWYSLATLKDPQSYIPPAKVPILAKAVVAACDTLDGIADGVLDDPRQCHFDPAVLTCRAGQDAASCFTPRQVKAIKQIWAGAHDSKGELIVPPIVPGGEDGPGGWSSWITGNRPFNSTHWKAADGVFQNMIFEDRSYNPLHFNYDTDMKTMLAKTSRSMDAVNPDLRPLRRRGGKLILYHGWSDPDISPLNTINYYNQVEATVGRDTPQFVRLFMVPGMNHCAGGPGPNHFDGVTALEEWVEDGEAPEKIIAFHTTEGEIDRTRPLCPYPQVAVYNGKGSTNNAANFSCRLPSQKAAR
ncbi:tannase/feruloyl esterase family alpha/beta hydrolase [Edaphobacter paludis]|uniref:Tannase/feruloyl esterase family alpha/beta hydrolase n=1 Tax=Edaphobacter paludis TaxID=3035702 RepID=A0AAU7D892_9BACT